MRISLINPPFVKPKSWGLPEVFQPLGLAYVASAMEAKGHKIQLIDANAQEFENVSEINGQYRPGMDTDDILDVVAFFRPEVVGISVPFSISQNIALTIGKAIQSSLDVDIVFGGPHPSAQPDALLNNGFHVVIGEGESVNFPELVEFKEPVCKQEFAENLDSLPFPARHLLPMNRYFEARRLGRVVRRNYVFHDRWISMITSRGCPFKCCFCSIHTVMGERYRTRSPQNVMMEIEQVIERYRIQHINFEDDNMSLDRRRFNQLLDLMIERDLGLTWSMPNGIRADTLDEATIIKMKMSGCRRVFVAPESGVQRIVSDVIGKNLNLAKVEQAVKLFKKHGIVCDGSFVIGFPGETKQDIQETIRFGKRLKRLGMNDAAVHLATPYYGTPLYELALKKGYLRTDVSPEMMTTDTPLISTPEFSLDDLRELRALAIWNLKRGILRDILYFVKHGNWKALRLRKLVVLILSERR